MMKRKRKPKFKKRYSPPKSCPICQDGLELDYKKSEILSRFISDRGKISSRGRSGVCAKHQRRLAQAIKRARFLALLPFVVKAK